MTARILSHKTIILNFNSIIDYTLIITFFLVHFFHNDSIFLPSLLPDKRNDIYRCFYRRPLFTRLLNLHLKREPRLQSRLHQWKF